MVLLSGLPAEYARRYGVNPSLRYGNSSPVPEAVLADAVCNSADASPGCLFCCVRGEHTDGHTFAEEAIANGAVALLVERLLPVDAPQIVSTNVRRDMGRLASIIHGEPSQKLKMVGVTGTNGKSTTTWIIRHILQSMGLRVGLLGTIVYNDGVNEVDAERTTPESCDVQRMLGRMVENGCDACVMETSSHGLALGRMEGCSFDSAVFTNLSEEHLDYHGTLEEYFETKSTLFSGCMKQDWTGGANCDDSYGRLLMGRFPRNLSSYGIDCDSDARLRAGEIDCSLEGTDFTVSLAGLPEPVRTFLPLPGLFNVYNALAALSAILPFCHDTRGAILSLKSMVQVPGRMERISFENGVKCVIDFAHTPVALKNVLTELRRLCRGRVISVFGHGGERFQPNRFSLGRFAAALSDSIIVTMDNPRNEPPEQIAAQIVEGVKSSGRDVRLRTILDRKAAVYSAMDSAESGDVVVISGKGPEKTLRIGSLSIDYSDYNAVRSWSIERGVRML